jgi:hypothetical protein
VALVGSIGTRKERMKTAGIVDKEAAAKRILNAGFRAVAEYDQRGRLVAARGVLSSEYAWTRVEQIAYSRAGMETEEKATAILLGDMLWRLSTSRVVERYSRSRSNSLPMLRLES